MIVDFSSNFKDKEVPTIDKLRRLAKEYAINNRLGLPKINTKIEYVDLSKTLDYKLTQILEEAELCDIVPIYYPEIGLTSEDAKLTTIVYDVLLEQNDSVEVGVIGDGFKSSMTSNLSGKIDDLASNQQRLVNTLPDYLLNAQGNKVWYNRPDNNEHKIGDIWFEKNGLYDRMYVWNGSQWEKRIDTEDIDKVKKEVDKQLEQAKQSTAIEIEKANAKAQEALIKAGTIPDTATLSDQIKTFILNSPDLNRKVTETFNNADNGDTIYSKIVSKVSKQFATRGEFESIDRVQNDMGRNLIGLSKQIATQTLEFNKLTESNKIYERILGKSETEAPDKLSRLVMSSEIFQTEIGKYSSTGGPNMLRNSRADDGLKYWTEANGRMSFTAHQYYFNGQKRMFQLSSGAFVHSPRFIIKQNTNYMLNLTAFDAGTVYVKISLCKRRKGSTADFDEKQEIFRSTGYPAFNNSKAIKKSFNFNTGTFDEGYLLIEYQGMAGRWSGLFMTELDFYEGSNERKWQPAPEDSEEPIEAVRTQVTQLAGSWAVKNLNSNGDVLNSINVLADGTNRIDGWLTHITGQTKIDNAVIKDGMIASLTADKITGGTIDASQVNVININASNVNAGVLQGLIFRGGRIESLDGTLAMDLNNKKIRLNGDNVGIVREFNGYPTQFIRYEASIENGHKHAKTIIGSNRNGTESWNSPSFAGIVIDNNANNSLDNIYQFGDHIHFKHSYGDDGWRFSNVSQIITPGVWNKNSEIWARAFVIPKETKGDTDTPTKFINLVDSVAALWKLWAHAKSQIGMTEAMKTVIQGSLDAWSYSRPHI